MADMHFLYAEVILNIFSSSCVGDERFGLNARRYGTHRETTVSKILELAMVSSLQLLCKYEVLLRCKACPRCQR